MCVCIYTDPIPFPSFFFFGLCLGLTMGFINAHSHGLARQLALCPHPSLTSTPRPHSVAIVFYTISIWSVRFQWSVLQQIWSRGWQSVSATRRQTNKQTNRQTNRNKTKTRLALPSNTDSRLVFVDSLAGCWPSFSRADWFNDSNAVRRLEQQLTPPCSCRSRSPP